MSDFKEFLIGELKKTSKTFSSDFLAEVSEKIKQLRKKRGLTQKQLSELTGITQNRISQIESGNANITLLTVEHIFSVLGVKIHLMEDEK